jgi:hypothetical protein
MGSEYHNCLAFLLIGYHYLPLTSIKSPLHHRYMVTGFIVAELFPGFLIYPMWQFLRDISNN